MNKSKNQISKKKAIRRVWAIHDLLDNPQRNIDIVNLWNRRGEISYEQIKKMTLSGMAGVVKTSKGYRRANIDDIQIWKPKKIHRSSVSKIFNDETKGDSIENGLITDNIVKKTIVNGQIGYQLVNSFESLYTILIEFSDPRFSKSFIRDMMNDLMKSSYAQNLINLDLVKRMKFLNDVTLTEKEMKFVLLILQFSPSALKRFLNEALSSGKWIEVDINGELNFQPEFEKENLLRDLQFLAYEDISYLFPTEPKLTFDPPKPLKIEFEIKTTLITENHKFNYVSKFQRSSYELLSAKEKNKEDDRNSKISEILKDMPDLTEDIPDLFEEEIDKRFDLNNSPLSYERKKH